MKKKAIVLGAGPAGLVTAWKLLEQNWDVQIIEKQPIVGGMCRSWKWDDFILDTGPHIFHTPEKDLAKFWKKEFKNNLIEGTFWCKNVRGKNFNEYWDYPISLESIKKYPFKIKEKINKELKNLKKEDKSRATNFKDYMEAQVGQTLTNLFFTKYPEKIWGIETKEMTPNWAPKRLELRKNITPFYYKQYCAVGKYGTGSIYEIIKKKIIKLNGKFNFKTTITGFDFENLYINRINIDKKSSIKINKDDVVISTLPLTLSGRFLGIQSDLKFRGIKSIYLAFKKSYVLPKHSDWLYYDSPEIIFNRVTENKKLSPHVAPKNKTFLTFEITFSKNDKIDRMSDKILVELVADHMEKAGIAKKSDVINSSVNSEYFVYPVQTKGYNEKLSILKSHVNKFQNLYSIGTGGDFNYADSQVLFHKAFDLVDILTNKNSKNTQTIKDNRPLKFNEIVTLGSKKIGGKNKPFIIAEIGLNHNGSIDVGKELIDKAVLAGCHAVKLQSFKPNSRVSKAVRAEKYVEKIIGLEEPMSDMFERLSLSENSQRILFKYARRKKIEIFSTPFDEESLKFLEKLKVKFYKIASMDLVNLPLIKKVAQTGKPIILSCGMSTIGQVEDAVNTVSSTGNKNLILLHCNSSYPSDPEEMNLETINTLKKNFQVPVGLSDHTFGILVSQMSISIGANIIERHFTLNRYMEGPDHILSSEFNEMKNLVSRAKKISSILNKNLNKNNLNNSLNKIKYLQKYIPEFKMTEIRKISKIVGDGIKKIEPNEYLNLNLQRKSIYAKKNIKKGEIIKENMLAIKGPAGGLLPKYFDIVVGRKAAVSVKEDHPITWDAI